MHRQITRAAVLLFSPPSPIRKTFFCAAAIVGAERAPAALGVCTRPAPITSPARPPKTSEVATADQPCTRLTQEQSGTEEHHDYGDQTLTRAKLFRGDLVHQSHRFINDHLGREIDQRHDFVNFATKPNWNLKTRKRLHRRGHHDNLNYGNRMRNEVRS